MVTTTDLRCLRVLDGIHPDATRTVVKIFLGQPYQPSESKSYRCPVRIEGLDYFHAFPDIGGWDALQSVELAISFANSILLDYTARGGRLYYPDTEEAYTPPDTMDKRLKNESGKTQDKGA